MILLNVFIVIFMIVIVLVVAELPSAIVYGERPKTRIAIALLALLCLGTTTAWMEGADTFIEGPKTEVGRYEHSALNAEMNGIIYQTVEGEYFLLEDNYWNIVNPTSRVYLNADKVTEYLAAYNIVHTTDMKNMAIQ